MGRMSGRAHIVEAQPTKVSAASAGASRNVRWERRGPAPRRSCFVVAMHVLPVVVVVLAGCVGGESAPDGLMDGSKASAPPVQLQGVEGPVVLTKIQVVLPSARGSESRSGSCLKAGRGNERPRGPSVERVGVRSETVTFEEESGKALFGCDNSLGRREGDRRWCGGAYGRLYGGHLRDPRLDIGGCSTDDDKPIAFVWVEPGPRARYVAVRQPGFREVYEPAASLPVRIATTSGFKQDPLGVTVDLSEHDASGRLLRTRRIEAFPAG